jgi:hypothetical protein
MGSRRLLLILGLVLALFVIVGLPTAAQNTKTHWNKLGVFMTPVIHRDQQITRSRILYLPPQAAAAISGKSSKPSGGGGGGGGGHHGGGGGGSCPTTNTGTYSVGCPVAPTTSMPEAEEEIAADPGAPGQTYVSAISDFSLRGGYNTTKWAITTTGGGSSSAWTQNFVPLGAKNQPMTSDGLLWDANSDPVVAIDNAHNVYLSDLYFTSSYLPNGLYVSVGKTSTLASGGNFDATNAVVVNTGSTAECAVTSSTNFCLEDKPWIAVDNSGTSTNGYIYATWSHFVDCENVLGLAIVCGPDSIEFAYSNDHGAHWSTPVRVSPPEQDGNVQGSSVAVGPDGTVYIAYEYFDPSGGNTRWQYLTSVSAGSVQSNSVSFPTPIQATPNGIQDINPNLYYYRVNSFPALAIGPHSQVYLTYADQPLGNAQIELTSCNANCGASTSFSTQYVNAATTNQELFPAIAVDSKDVVHISWFDTRNSPNNTSAFDVYAAFESSFGSLFSPVARVTPSTINSGEASFIGDYSGIAAVVAGNSTFAQPVWNNFAETCGVATCRFSGTMQTATLTKP